jgi:RNA-directed DNA polymerase
VEERLMEKIVSRENMMVAYRRVMANKGAAGMDHMTVEQLAPHLKEHWPGIREELLDDRYRPKPVRGVELPKPGGGMRQLGIPTVLDRLIQQAMHQVLMPLFDPGFSASSYGFRPGRRAHDAVLAARAHMADGRRFVVDLDLEKFFDRVNHDVLMARVARRVEDKRVLRLIRRYLQAGLMTGGLTTVRTEGTPQGGPLSPLLSKHPARRSRQGTRATRPRLLPLCRRLQHLCADEGRRRTGDGLDHAVPCRTAAAQGQQCQERC